MAFNSVSELGRDGNLHWELTSRCSPVGVSAGANTYSVYVWFAPLACCPNAADDTKKCLANHFSCSLCGIHRCDKKEKPKICVNALGQPWWCVRHRHRSTDRWRLERVQWVRDLLFIHVNDFHVHGMNGCEYVCCTLNDTFSCFGHCDWRARGQKYGLVSTAQW